MKKFHGIEFELPKDYLLVDKDRYLSFLNNTIGLVDAWLTPYHKESIAKGWMAIIFKEDNIRIQEIDSQKIPIPNEYIILRVGSLDYPNIKEEEFLKKFQQEDLAIEQTSTPLKCEISNTFSFAKYSIYNEKKYEDGQTSYAYHFYPSEGSKMRYVIEMNTGIFNYDVDLSKENFKKILNSIKVK